MSFTNQELINMVAKAVQAGVLDAAGAAAWYEAVREFSFVLAANKIWVQSDTLKAHPAPDVTTARGLAAGDLSGVVEDRSQFVSAVRLTPLTAKGTYEARATYDSFSSELLDNWISPQFVPQLNGLPSFGYAIRLFDGDPNVSVNEITTTDGATGTGLTKSVAWVFNYANGRLLLSDDYSVTDPWIVGFRYIGTIAGSGGAAEGDFVEEWTYVSRAFYNPTPLSSSTVEVLDITYLDVDVGMPVCLFVGTATEFGDTSNQLSGYALLAGVLQWHLDARGRLHLSVIDAGGGTFFVAIYKDEARTELLARSDDYTGTGSVDVTDVSGSGVSGQLTVDAVGPATTSIFLEYFRWYIVEATASTVLTLAGTSLSVTSSWIKDMWVGRGEAIIQKELFVPGEFANGGSTTLLDDNANGAFMWMKPFARLVKAAARAKVLVNTPTVKLHLDGTAAMLSGLQLTAAKTWVESIADIDPANCALNKGTEVEVESSNEGAGDNHLSVQLVAALEGRSLGIEIPTDWLAAPEMDLDSRYGYTFAPSALQDGDMEHPDASKWPLLVYVTPTKVAGQRPGGSGALILHLTVSVGFTNGWVAQSVHVHVVPGFRRYRVTGWARGDGVSTYPVVSWGSIPARWNGTTSNSWQYFDVTYDAQHPYLFLEGFGSPAGGGYVEFDDVTHETYQLSAWADQSKSNHAVQAVGLRQPTLVPNAMNGLPVVRFDGLYTYMTISQFATFFTEAEIFAVAKITLDPPVDALRTGWWHMGQSATVSAEFPGTDGVIRDGFGSTTVKGTVNPAQSLTSPFIYNVSSALGRWTNRLNGNQLWTTDSNIVGWHSTTIMLGTTWAAPVRYMEGVFSRILVYNRVLTNEQRANKLAELKTLYGIP
jgi:hypothetical protein